MVMQGLRLKFGDRRTDWKCCFCCHVRTGTIFIGVWYLLIHAVVMSLMAVIASQPGLLLVDPVLPTPLSEVDHVNHEFDGREMDWTVYNDASTVKPTPLLPRSFKELWEHQNSFYQDLHVAILVAACSIAMVLMMLYGTVKGKPGYLMPFFCLKVFDFCVAGISAIGYLCYPPDMGKYWEKQLSILPLKEDIKELGPDTFLIVSIIGFIIVMAIKAYFISIIWRCYKYLSYRRIAAQRTVHFIDPVVQNLLPDLPDYETAVKKLGASPPSYATATHTLGPLVVDLPDPQPNCPQPSAPENTIDLPNIPAGNAAAPNQLSAQANKPEII